MGAPSTTYVCTPWASPRASHAQGLGSHQQVGTKQVLCSELHWGLQPVLATAIKSIIFTLPTNNRVVWKYLFHLPNFKHHLMPGFSLQFPDPPPLPPQGYQIPNKLCPWICFSLHCPSNINTRLNGEFLQSPCYLFPDWSYHIRNFIYSITFSLECTSNFCWIVSGHSPR